MDSNRYKRKILIDLDGVLNKYGQEEQFNENFIPEIREGAFDFIKDLSNFSELYLFTTGNLMLSAKWLIDNNVDEYFKDVKNVKLP